MAYGISMKKSGGNGFFVPQCAAEDLSNLSAAEMRALLFVLSSPSREASPEDVSGALGISLGDASDILDMWVRRGVLECGGQTAAAEAGKTPSAPSETGPVPPKITKGPVMKPSMDEVRSIIKGDSDIRAVLDESEKLLGITFTKNDTADLVYFIHWYGMPPEVLLMVIQYCSEHGRRSMHYIKKMAAEWVDSEIDSLEKAEARIRAIEETASWEGTVRKALEIRDRSLVPKEKEFCEAWRKMGLSPELIRAAYEKTIEQTGKLAFAYMNKILVSWQQKGIDTPEKAAAETKSPSFAQASPSFDIDDITRRLESGSDLE